VLHPRITTPPPSDLDALIDWIRARIREPHPLWRPTTAAARSLPVPVNLPGMDRVEAMVLARFRNMSLEWRREVIQDYMGNWLLRPETPVTLAVCAVRRVGRGVSISIESAIGWKLGMEMRSRASRAYKPAKREAAGLARYAQYQRARRCSRRWQGPVVREEKYGPMPVRRVPVGVTVEGMGCPAG
jgi:hypothetical protein